MKTVAFLIFVHVSVCFDKDFLSKFQQSDYQTKDIRGELLRYDKNVLRVAEFKTFKYNRSTAAFNITANFKIDLRDKLEMVVQVYKLASNEFRDFPIRFRVNAAKAYNANILGVKSFSKCGNVQNVYFLKVDAVTGKTITRRELLEQSIKLTYIFTDLGITTGDTITIISENQINYVAVILAGLYTGVLVCSLNPSYSLAELQHSLLHVKPKLVVCSMQAFDNLDKLKNEFESIKEILIIGESIGNAKHVNTLQERFEAMKANVANFKPAAVNPVEDGALIFMSSGTTGMPKAVLVNQECIRICVNSFMHPNCGNGGSFKSAILLIPLFHIFGLMVQFYTLASSTKGVIMRKFQPDPFLKSIENHKVNLLYLVPSLIVFFAKSSTVLKYDLSSIENIYVGGAPTSKGSLKEAEERFGKVKIRQLYGVTETGGVVTMEPKCSNKAGTIGKLIPGFAGKVVGLEDNTPVKPFEVGELCFKSLGTMKGYLKQSGLYRVDFDDDGFYHSGDMGYYDEDNYFYVVDRIKELIKYKSFQVAPAELEALILTHPGVKDCAVTSILDEKAGELPLGLVVRKEDDQVTEKEIIDYVAERISIQKHLHGGVRFVEQIPKNPTGKILRRLLKETVENGQLF